MFKLKILRNQKVSLIDSSYSDKDLNKRIKNGVPLSIDLASDERNKLVGYKAKQFTPLIDIDKSNNEEFLLNIKS